VTLKNGEVSSCEYLESDNAHYAIAASEIKITPHEARFYDIKHADFDKGDSSVLLVNGVVKIYGVPVLWLPVFYKPKEENLGLAGMQFGKSGDWGFFVNLYREIQFSDAPDFRAKLHLDFYEERGIGYGIEGRVNAPESRTDFFVYSIYDKDQFEKDDYHLYRVKVPHNRYDFRISNVTHITPQMDFRGMFDYQSDPYIMRDFFENEYNKNPQPATFAALEQQFDRFSLSGYMSFRTNDFFNTVEKIPQIRMDIPRQEIFDTGLYYQGDFDASYMKRKWIDFDRNPAALSRYSKLQDYDAFRFDMTHFLYYPVRNRYFTLVPRIGFKLTAYSDSSKTKVTDDDLQKMYYEEPSLPRISSFA
jgi:hypothetical protein